MKNKKLNIGVFGGGRGYVMIEVLMNHPHARLAAVCDKYEPLLDKVRAKAESLGQEVSLYNNFEDFLNHPELDAVVLANYATEHATFAIRCMKAGKHVLSEVLPSETIAQAVEYYKENKPRGEFVLVIRGKAVEKGPRIPLEEAMEVVARYRAEGKSLKEAAKLAAVETGQSKNDLYHAALVQGDKE
jgi:hypothetical protein